MAGFEPAAAQLRIECDEFLKPNDGKDCSVSQFTLHSVLSQSLSQSLKGIHRGVLNNYCFDWCRSLILRFTPSGNGWGGTVSIAPHHKFAKANLNSVGRCALCQSKLANQGRELVTIGD